MMIRLLTFALFLVVTPTFADVIRIARPRYQPVQPAPHVSTGLEVGSLLRSSGTAPDCADSGGNSIPCAVDMQYFGGSVLSNVKVYAVLWNSEVNPIIAADIGGFYQTLTNSEWMDWLTEYSTNIPAQTGSHANQPGTHQLIGRGTFAGTYTLPVLSKNYSPCSSSNPAALCIKDSDIENELDWQVLHGYLPVPDADSIFVVHFPPSVTISDPGFVSCQQFCAYHSTYQARYQSKLTNVRYAVVPDFASNGCTSGCGVGTTFENTCSAASHEIGETTTDSDIGLVGNSVDYPAGWYDTETPSQGEIGDMCNQHTDTLSEEGLTGCIAGSADCYTVQQLFSQVAWAADTTAQPGVAACVASRFDANDYSIALSPTTLTVAPGATAPSIPVLTNLTNGNTQRLTLSVSQVPPGLHAHLDTTSLNAGSTAHLTVSADANATPLRDAVVVVRATGATSHSAALLVQLAKASNDWGLYVSPANTALLPATSRVYTVGGLVRLGTAEPISVSSAVTGLPPGVTASFNTLTLTPGVSTSQLTLTASSSAAAVVSTPFTISGSSRSQPAGHTASANVQVDTAPTVVFTSPAAGAAVTGVALVHVQATPGTNANLVSITISVDNEAPLSSGTEMSTSWDTTGTTSNGGHTLKATVLDDDGATASASVNVNVQNSDFTLALSPQTVAVPVGGSADFTVTTTLAAGSAEPVALNLSGLPPGLRASFSPSPVTAGSTATLTLTADSGTALVPATTVTLVGTSPSQPSGHASTASVSIEMKSGGGCASTSASNPTPGLLSLLGAFFFRRRRGLPACGRR